VVGVIACLQSLTAISAEPQARNSWQELGLLNIGRYGCRAHSIDGYRAIVIAGWGDQLAPPDTSAEILDTTIGQWTFTAPMPVDFAPGANPWTAKLKDGYFLVAGGFNAVHSQSLASYIYSVSNDTWIRTGDMPVGATAGSNFGQVDAIVLDDGRVLVAGGLAAGVGETNASLVFTPNYRNLASGLSGEAAGTWDFTRDHDGHVTYLSGPSEHHKLIKLKDGRVLLIVGYDKRFVTNKAIIYRDTPGVQAELFDPGTGVWTPLPDMPAIPGEDDRHDGVQGIRQMASVALLGDGRVLVAGGFSSPTDDRGRPLLKSVSYERSSAILFDPDLHDQGAYPWSVTAPMHVARDAQAMGNLPGSAGILTVWGWTQTAWTATSEVYDSAQGTWRIVAPLPAQPNTDMAISQPWGCTAMMPDGSMLVIGGQVDVVLQGTSRRTFRYRP
jgi:hypothetical protein